MSEERQLADRLASYADAVAAVSFVNALAFFVGIADQDVRCSLADLRVLVVCLAVALHGAYALAIWLFRRGEVRLRRADSEASQLVEAYRGRIFWSRMAFVALVGAATIVVTWFGISEGGCPQ